MDTFKLKEKDNEYYLEKDMKELFLLKLFLILIFCF